MTVAPAAARAHAAPGGMDRDAEVRRVARDLEGLFLREVLRVMRETVPESPILGGGFAGDLYSGMFDDEIAARAGRTGLLGLDEAIVRQLGAARAAAAYGPPIAPAAPGSPASPAAPVFAHPLPEGAALPTTAVGRFAAPRPPSRWHHGVDLHAPVGASVRAVADGVVARVERDAERGGRAGRYLRIEHDGGWVTRYLHLDAVRDDLREGDRVRAGEPIATVGRTGVRRSVPHLHFALSRDAAGAETYVDPTPWLRAANTAPLSDDAAGGGPP